jgi:hypothetical protein
MDVKAYAESIGRKRDVVQDEVQAARVADAVGNVTHDLSSHYQKLTAIHAAPRDEWRALVSRVVEENLTVEQTRAAVRESDRRARPRRILKNKFRNGS